MNEEKLEIAAAIGLWGAGLTALALNLAGPPLAFVGLIRDLYVSLRVGFLLAIVWYRNYSRG